VVALVHAGLLGWGSSHAADAPPPTPADAASGPHAKPTRGQLPLFFEADRLRGESGGATLATGNVRIVQGDMHIRADSVTHEGSTNTATALGHVRIVDNGNLFSGPSLTLQLDTEQGEFIEPRFWFVRTGAGGSAQKIEFLGHNRLQAYWTSYSSCTPANTADGQPGEPDWSLKTSKVYLDMNTSEGRAEDAVIWFKGVPILAAPKLTFPLDDRRKSGWLPPSFDYDSKSGFEFSAPYYWNIAPAQDMTLAPLYSVRRGLGLDTEYRYLLPGDGGTWHVVARPDDRVALRSRGLLDLSHLGSLEGAVGGDSRTDYELRWRRISDDDYWKDFSHNLPSLMPRQYDSHANLQHTLNARNWGLGDSQTVAYGSVQSWQTLRDMDPAADPTLSQITTPYRRTPQLGLRSTNGQHTGLNWSVNGEFNRFTNADPNLANGNRLQVQGEMSLPYALGGLNVLPKLALRSTSYDLVQPLANGSVHATRTVPTFSLDSTAVFERPVHWFSRELTQTLEPRVQYVRTAYRDQSDLPLFDTAPRDFNQYAIFTENAFSGGDRINDANQLTMGLSTRLLDQQSGAEALRLGVVQKLLLADQRINPDGDLPITQRLSDLLLLGSASVVPNWWVDGSTQYGAQDHALQRGLLGVRFSPGAWHTVNVNYRYTRGASEQYELGWQWPLWGRPPQGRQMGTNPANGNEPSTQDVREQALADPLNLSGQNRTAGNDCTGTWYSVGRLSYSARDARLTDALAGVEYDAGCWVGRVVAQRVSVGRTQASTRIMFQLELIGLSRISLGNNPLKALKDNIPGYRLLRDDSKATTTLGDAPPSDDD
jgi:LPS-assembly protein